jgi:SecD/SecF fusion protein
MNVTMEVSLAELTKSLAEITLMMETLTKHFKTAQRISNAGGGDFISAFVTEYEKLAPGGKLADFFANQENATALKANASNSDVKSFLATESKSAIDRSFIIIYVVVSMVSVW